MDGKPEERKNSLEEEIVRILAEKGLTVTTAESCTGGLIAGTLINAAGASEVFNEGYITYSNGAAGGRGSQNPGKIRGGQRADSEGDGGRSGKGGRSRRGAERNGHRGTGGRHRGKAGRSCIYRMFPEWENRSTEMHVYRRQAGKQAADGGNSACHAQRNASGKNLT